MFSSKLQSSSCLISPQHWGIMLVAIYHPACTAALLTLSSFLQIVISGLVLTGIWVSDLCHKANEYIPQNYIAPYLGSEIRETGFEYWFSGLLVLWPQASYFTYQSPSFFNSTREIVTDSFHRVVIRFKECNAYKEFIFIRPGCKKGQ